MGKTSTYLSYPSDPASQLVWWTRRIDYFYSYMQPWMEACQVLQDQYSINDATERERYQKSIGAFDSDPSYRVKTNLVYGWIDQSISSMTSSDPAFRVKALNQAAAGKEFAVSRVSTDVYGKTGQLEQDERVLLDAHLTPWGGSKIGYSFDVDAAAVGLEEMLDPTFYSSDNPSEEANYFETGYPVTAMPDNEHAIHIEFHTNYLQQPSLDAGIASVVRAHIKEHQHYIDRPAPDMDSRVKWDLPFGQRWEPDKIIIDPFASDGPNNAMFIAFRSTLPVDLVKSNPLYSNTTDLQPSARMENAPLITKELEYDDFGLVDIYEIWGRNIPVGPGRTEDFWGVYADGHDKWLSREREWPYYFGGDFPLELLNFHSSTRTWFNKPPLLMAGGDSIQSLSNEMLDAMLSTVRKEKNIFLYDPQFIDKDEIFEILRGDDMDAFAVDGLADSNGKAVMPLAFGKVNTDKNMFLGQIQNLLDRSAGTPDPMRGKSPDSATEANIVDSRASSRDDKREAKFTKFQVNKTKKFWDLMIEFRPDRVFLLDQVLEGFVIDESVAEGRFEFKIDISSSAQAKGLERKQWMDLLNLLSGQMYQLITQQYGQPPNIARLLELLLVRGYDIYNPEEILPFLPEVTSQGGINDQAILQQQIQMAAAAAQAAPPTAGANPNTAAAPANFTDQAGVAESRVSADANRRDRGGSFGGAGSTAETS